jgi:hypothetical protein
MKRGTTVLYLNDPLLYGVGSIVAVLEDGRLSVQWPDLAVEDFDAHELVEYDEFNAGLAFAELEESRD